MVAAGFLLTAVSLCSIVGLPKLFGIPFGLILLKNRFDFRTRHLERCRRAERAAVRLSEVGAKSRAQEKDLK